MGDMRINKIKFIIGIVVLLVIVLMGLISYSQLRWLNGSRFEAFEAEGNYLIFAEFENNSIVPIKIKSVSLESENSDSSFVSISDWGIWVDNDSLLGAMKLTDEAVKVQKKSNVKDYLVTDKVKFTVFFRPVKDSMSFSESNISQSIIIRYSVLGFPKEIKYQINR